MKTFIKENFLLIAPLCMVVCYLFVSLMTKKSDQHNHVASVRIAVFQPASHPALDEIAQGFVDTMKDNASLNYVFDHYNGNGNKILMQAQAQEILQKNYDLIFTIAVSPSVTIKDLCYKKHNQTPIVFTAIDDPVKLDLQGPMITGVIDQANYQEQIDLLCAIKPSIQKMLLVYDQSQASGLEKDKNQIKSILQTQGITLTCVEILNMSEIQQKVSSSIASADVVMVLKDSTVVSGIDSLISLCERYHVPLLASDLNSGAKGAALAYGIYEAESGIQAAHQAKLILEDGKSPCQVPVIAVTNMKMKINGKHAKLQGLVLDFHNFSLPGVELDEKGSDYV